MHSSSNLYRKYNDRKNTAKNKMECIDCGKVLTVKSVRCDACRKAEYDKTYEESTWKRRSLSSINNLQKATYGIWYYKNGYWIFRFIYRGGPFGYVSLGIKHGSTACLVVGRTQVFSLYVPVGGLIKKTGDFYRKTPPSWAALLFEKSRPRFSDSISERATPIEPILCPDGPYTLKAES